MVCKLLWAQTRTQEKEEKNARHKILRVVHSTEMKISVNRLR